MLVAIRQNAFPITLLAAWVLVAAYVLAELASTSNVKPVLYAPEVVIEVARPAA